MPDCLERVSNAAQSLTSHTMPDSKKALSPQGRLESAALTLLPLDRRGEFAHVKGGQRLFNSIMKRLTAREPGPDDGEECGAFRATCSKLSRAKSKKIAADLLELFWRVEEVERPAPR